MHVFIVWLMYVLIAWIKFVFIVCRHKKTTRAHHTDRGDHLALTNYTRLMGPMVCEVLGEIALIHNAKLPKSFHSDIWKKGYYMDLVFTS